MVFPRQQDLCGGAGLHGELGPHRNGVTQADGTFRGCHADTPVALAAEDLRAFACGVPELNENGSCGGDEPVLTGSGCELHQPAAQDEASLDVPAHQAMVNQSQRKAVNCGPGKPRGRYELRESRGPCLKGIEHLGRFINDTDSTRIVHVMILPSQYLRCKLFRWPILRRCCFSGTRTTQQANRSEGSKAVGKTLAEKVWDAHVVRKGEGEGANAQPDLLFIDLHLVHEVTSPQAFEGLRLAGRPLRRVDLTIATEDHNTPTLDIDKPIADLTSRTQIETLRANCKEFGVRLHSLGDKEQGIVHVVGPQLGLTQPGMTVVCGDSHTSTHGAFGALAMGIGTSEVEHVMATQTLSLKPFKTMAINVEGTLRPGVTAKDIILAVIAKIGTGGGQGYVLEYRGSAIRALSMDARMTICNMSIEAGARAGMVAPDQTTYDYMQGRPHAPEGADWDAAVEYWNTLNTDADATFDVEVDLDADTLEPFVTWGTNPGQGVSLSAKVPSPEDFGDENAKAAAERALQYMGLEAGTPMKDIRVDTVFLGSCTNSRIEDLRAAADIIRGREKDPKVRMLVVPGSARVRLEAEAEGLDKVFKEFGAEWRFAGCSMCLGMNPDQLEPGERCASTSNRNFEGRQGKGGRTHLVSPVVAAATAVRGTLSSPSDLESAAAGTLTGIAV